MKTRFSKTEWAGILLMAAGLVTGCLGRVIAVKMRSSAMAELQQGLSSRQPNAVEVKTSLTRTASKLTSAETFFTVEGIGFWIFLAGIAVFVVARRGREDTGCRLAEDAPSAGPGQAVDAAGPRC